MGLLFERWYLDIVFIIIALLSMLVASIKHTYGHWSRKGVPYIPPQFPFGNTKGMAFRTLSFGETVQGLYKHFKSQGHRFAGIYIMSNPIILIIDPELVKNVLAKDFAYFAEKNLLINEKEPLTCHLMALTGTKWKNLRQTLTPTFTPGKIKMMFQTLLACAEGLEGIMEEYAKNKEDIDIKDVSGRFSTDVIGSCAFGIECNSLQNPEAEFRQFGRKLFTLTTFGYYKEIMSRIFPKLYSLLNLRQIDKEISNFFIKVIADTIDYREKNNIKRNDFLQLLMNIKNTGDVDAKDGSANGAANGQRLTIEEIAAQSFIFFVAGFETSSTAMSFFLYDMAVHPDIQDKVRKEINDMLNRYDGKITYEGMMELQYLEMALYESMRLHSAIPGILRRCTKNYKIPESDVVIEKHTTVALSFFGLQSDPEYYPEPDKYDPERFTNEEKAKRHPFTFLPFGEGPKVCIGQRFGLLQTKLGLAVILKNHRITVSKKMRVPLVIDPKSLIFAAVGGIWLNAESV